MDVDMTGRVCMVTGATAGIGEVTALELARMGARVIVVSRSPEKCAATVERIKRETGNHSLEAMPADLSSQESIRELVERFKSRYRRLHVLLNNAGGINATRKETVDGLELTFALNHLGYFLLTGLLMENLKASAPARIINVASQASRRGWIDFDDLEKRKRYKPWTAYNQSKLANILFTYELARRLEGTGVTANCLHPGFVASRFGLGDGGRFAQLMRLAQLIAISPEKGADTSIYLAIAPELEAVSGKYFIKRKEARSKKVSYDLEVARRLWEVSEAMTGFTWPAA